MTNRKILIITNEHPTWVDADADVPTGWGKWLTALAITVVGIGGIMALCIWLMG